VRDPFRRRKRLEVEVEAEPSEVPNVSEGSLPEEEEAGKRLRLSQAKSRT
jgi:hypothetical protein